jgi:hypothetical protein
VLAIEVECGTLRGHRPGDVVSLGAVPSSNQAKGFGYPDSKSGHRGEAATPRLARGWGYFDPASHQPWGRRHGPPWLDHGRTSVATSDARDYEWMAGKRQGVCWSLWLRESNGGGWGARHGQRAAERIWVKGGGRLGQDAMHLKRWCRLMGSQQARGGTSADSFPKMPIVRTF